MVVARLLLCLLRDIQRWWKRLGSSCKQVEDLKLAMKQSQSGICAHHDSPQHLSNVSGYIYQTANIYVFPGGPVVQRLYRVQHLYGTPSSMLHAMHTSLAMMS